MKKYRCKESFIIDTCADGGFLTEKRDIVIEKGEVFELDENGRGYISGSEIHLDNVNGKNWIEISQEHLEKYFELVEEE